MKTPIEENIINFFGANDDNSYGELNLMYNT